MAIYEVNHSDLDNPNRLTDLEYSYRLPRFIPNTNQLILLKRRPYGPHMDCDQLVSFDLGGFLISLIPLLESHLKPFIRDKYRTNDC